LPSAPLPSRKFAKYLHFDLRRTVEVAKLNGDDVSKAARFCLKALRKTNARDFCRPQPKSTALSLRHTGPLKIVGGASHEFHQGSSTSIGELLHDAQRKLGLTLWKNGFGLFETHEQQRANASLEENLCVADVMSEWEKCDFRGLGTWKFVFTITFVSPRDLR
jgi:hypothetical protein